MTDNEKREAARQFCNKWQGKGREDEDDRSYWLDILSRILGVENATDYIEFQKKVIVDGNTKRIDAYIPETKVLIEQKTLGIQLDKKGHQSGGIELTPYEQAKRYNDNLPYDEKARWIVTSNFAEIWIYDMNMRVPEPVVIHLHEITNRYNQLEFLLNKKEVKISQEMEVSVKAGELVGLIYDALYKQYIDPTNEHSLKSLNMLCVRLVFCLYAEDAKLFGTNGHMFNDYLSQYDANGTRKALIELFKILDTREEDRDPYDDSMLSKFPYVNGGLFADENIEIPKITDEIRDIILHKASEDFDWSVISPTIFGAVFESTLNPDTRRSGGMHYTSIENIHKVIDPLFLDDLHNEFEIAKEKPIAGGSRTKAIQAFQNKLANLKFLDPACGSGNFLTETYISLRKLENLALCELNDEFMNGQLTFITSNESLGVKVSISQFYGIEINDFAVTVAKTALWIAESQMLKNTENIVGEAIPFLPLKTNAYIHEQNALDFDWSDIVDRNSLNYIIGNPPFVGARLMGEKQKKDVEKIFCNWKSAGDLDYVACWYKKCADFIKGTSIKVALVSTNSVVQGESVAILWKPLFEQGISIDFAHKTFIWDSEASIKAHVHCVIIGFSSRRILNAPKYIFTGDNIQSVNRINAYLVDAEDVFIESRKKPLCDVPEIAVGNKPIDDGQYLFTEDEMKEFIKKEPYSEKFFHKWYGAKEFINRCPRYCLYLLDAKPEELRKMPEAMKRIAAVKEFRLKSTSAGTRKLAETPMKFHITNIPKDSFIVIPETSSERRRYVPMGFLKYPDLCSNAIRIMPNVSLFHFGVLVSNVHMAWMRTVCGRLKSDYRYSIEIVYNNFPWCNPTDEQRALIEQTAQGILDARAKYESSSLADLYDPLIMPEELLIAHRKNDVAVMKAYGFDVRNTSESDCVAQLFKLYLDLVKEK